MWEWVVIGVLYAVGMGFFHLLGGLAAAGRAIERWGHAHSTKKAKELGLIRS
jgi:hypothetical protein